MCLLVFVIFRLDEIFWAHCSTNCMFILSLSYFSWRHSIAAEIPTIRSASELINILMVNGKCVYTGTWMLRLVAIKKNTHTHLFLTFICYSTPNKFKENSPFVTKFRNLSKTLKSSISAKYRRSYSGKWKNKCLYRF